MVFYFARNQHLFVKTSDAKDHEIWYFADGKSEAEVAILFGDPLNRNTKNNHQLCQLKTI